VTAPFRLPLGRLNRRISDEHVRADHLAKREDGGNSISDRAVSACSCSSAFARRREGWARLVLFGGSGCAVCRRGPSLGAGMRSESCTDRRIFMHVVGRDAICSYWSEIEIRDLGRGRLLFFSARPRAEKRLRRRGRDCEGGGFSCVRPRVFVVALPELLRQIRRTEREAAGKRFAWLDHLPSVVCYLLGRVLEREHMFPA